MASYLTPVKDSLNCNKQTKSQCRDGDWVCINCNNLNFSFRKKCNRCKTQTREQNEATSNYSFYYYTKSYYLDGKSTQYEHSAQHLQVDPCVLRPDVHIAVSQNILVTPARNDKENITPEKREKADLPSVSPLLKKYNARDTLSHQRYSRGLFGNSPIWDGIHVKQFDQRDKTSMAEEGQDCQETSDELEKLINGIIL